MNQFEQIMDILYALVGCLCPVFLLLILGLAAFLLIRSATRRRARNLREAIKGLAGLDQSSIAETIHAGSSPTAPLSSAISNAAQLLGKLSQGDITPLSKGLLKNTLQVLNRYYEQASAGYLPDVGLNDLRREDLSRIADFTDTLSRLVQAIEQGDRHAVEQYFKRTTAQLVPLSTGHRAFTEQLAAAHIPFPAPPTQPAAQPQTMEELIFLKNQLIADLYKGNLRQKREAATRLARLYDPALFIHLVQFYADPDPALRQIIQAGIRDLGSEQASNFLALPEPERQEALTIYKAAPLPAAYIPRKPAQEALDAYDRAIEQWDAIPQSQFEQATKDIMLMKELFAKMALAIFKANAPFPEAHTGLAVFSFYMEDYAVSEKHTRIALLQDPNQFDAQYQLLMLLNQRIIAQSDLTHRLEFPANFVPECARLEQIYRYWCKTNQDVDAFLEKSKKMIVFGHNLQEATIPGKPNLYQAVATAPIDHLDLQDKKQAVQELQGDALGYASQFKN